MTNTQHFDFIIIDDDTFNNTICQMVLKKNYGNISITTFTRPEDALTFFKNDFILKKSPNKEILLLDINMPSMSGWEFLDEYEKLDETIKNRLTIYILSSSVDERDIDRSKENKYVTEYFIKPIKNEYIQKILAR